MYKETDYCSQEIEENFITNLLFKDAYFTLDGEVTEEHFIIPENKKLFAAIKSLSEKALELSPISLFAESGVSKEVIERLISGHVPWSLAHSYKLLDEYRQKRMLVNKSNALLNKFKMQDGYNVAEELQKLSEELAEGITVEVKKGDFSERTREHLKQLEQGAIKGIRTGIGAFDDAVGEMFGGELHILAGFPSVGKSALALQISRSMAKSGFGVRYFSLEEVETSYMKRIISAETGFPYSAYRNGLTEAQRKQQNFLYQKVFGDGGTLSGKNFEIDDINDTLESIYISSAKHKIKHGLEIIIIDGATNIHHRETNIYNRSEDIAQSCLRMAKRLNITVILLSHINNDLMKKDKDGKKKVPDMSCLMGGQCLTKPSFSVTILDRVTEEFVPNHATAINGYLVKSRNSAPNQIMEFDFDGVKQTYSSRNGNDRW